MIDETSPQFRELLAAWLDALKVMDTKLHAYYTAVAALQNSQFAAAAPYLKDVVVCARKDPILVQDMDRKYDSALRRWEQQAREFGIEEALASWLRAFQLEKSQQS